MKKGEKVLINRLDVQEIIFNRATDSMEKTLNYLIEEKGLLLETEAMEMIYELTRRYSEQITDFVIAHNRGSSITGSGGDSATDYFHSSWQI